MRPRPQLKAMMQQRDRPASLMTMQGRLGAFIAAEDWLRAGAAAWWIWADIMQRQNSNMSTFSPVEVDTRFTAPQNEAQKTPLVQKHNHARKPKSDPRFAGPLSVPGSAPDERQAGSQERRHA